MNDTANTTATPSASPSASPSIPVATPLRLAAAAAVLVGGLVHLQLYFDGYRDFPNHNLGRSFLANGIASVFVAAALVVRRDAIIRLAGIAVSIGTLAAFAKSRTDSGIFGFFEHGFRPSPQAALTLVTEILAIVLLAATFLPRIGAGRQLQIRLAAPIAVAVLAVAGVMSVLWARSPAEGTASAGTAAVTIKGFAFNPPEVTVAAGSTVTWTNQDSFTHTTTGKDGVWDSTDLPTGQSFSFTFDTAGTFTYICNIHPSMAGTIVVTP